MIGLTSAVHGAAGVYEARMFHTSSDADSKLQDWNIQSAALHPDLDWLGGGLGNS